MTEAETIQGRNSYRGWFLDISRTASRIATNPTLAYWNAFTPYPRRHSRAKKRPKTSASRCGAAALVITILQAKHTPLGQTANATLLYGIAIGPIIEEILFRGAAFSVIYVTAASIKGLLRLRLAIAIVLSSVLFALAHTRTMGIPWLVFFGMGMLYALLRWRSNSTATAALMHTTYNAVISIAMLRH